VPPGTKSWQRSRRGEERRSLFKSRDPQLAGGGKEQ